MRSAEPYMRLAKKMAIQSEEQFKLGACLVKSGKVLGLGKNFVNHTNWIVKEHFAYPTVHAEIHCLVRLDEDDIRGSVIYVWRQKRTGEAGMAKPCERCARVLAKFGVKRVIYTTDNGEFGVWKPERLAA